MSWLGCTDSPPDSDWSCIEFDGTGLWCDACNDRASTERLRRYNEADEAQATEAARRLQEWRDGCKCHGGPHGGYTCPRCAS